MRSILALPGKTPILLVPIDAKTACTVWMTAQLGSGRLYNEVMCRVTNYGRWIAGLTILAAVTSSVRAQTPQPFPRGGQPAQTQRPPAAPATAVPPAAPAKPAEGPTAATLGFPIYPGSQFLASYDAGRGQRYYLFGTTAPYADIVLFYRTQLDERGDVVFKEPPTHMFNVGRFRDETMAFPPGVTVKDWTWGGSKGYPNTRLRGEPARFPTVVMIVPSPPAVAPPAR